MNINVIGLGYIGFPTAVTLADNGHKVVGIDTKQEVVESLNLGEIHIEEPGVKELLNSCLQKGTFKASLVPEQADVFIVAVPTPNKDDQFLSCDLTHVLNVCERILPYLTTGNVVIIESTIAPRTMVDYIQPFFEKQGWVIGQNLYLAHCPERVLPGKVLYELIHNNRIIGGITEECSIQAAKVYSTVVQGELILTESKIAEMSKCMENTFRDVNIALANELAKICIELNIDVYDVIRFANKHPRVNIHSPGPGVGGHCLAVDPYFIYSKAPESAQIIKLSRDINNSMPTYVVDIVNKLLNYDTDAKIAVFGLTYKGNIDDIRESPAIEIVQLLEKLKYKVKTYDPHVNNFMTVSLEEAVNEASLILVLSDHNEFKQLDLSEISKTMNKAVIFDTKNIISISTTAMQVVNYGNVAEYLSKNKVFSHLAN